MTHTFDFNDDLALDTGEFMAFDDIENDIDDDDMNFLHDDDFMQFEEGDLFFKKLWRGVKKVARAAAPIAKQLAPTIGKIVGGAVGSFAGAPTIGATVGTHLGNFVQNLEDEGDGSFAGLEADTDTHDEMEAEDFIKPSEDDEGLAEYMASAAATAKTAVDSAAMAGGIATAATAKSPSKVRAIAPVLSAANARAAKVMAQDPNSKVLMKTLPTITQKTVATLTKKAAKGKPVTAKTASRVMAKHAVKTLSQSKELTKALAKNEAKTRKVNMSAISRAERFAY